MGQAEENGGLMPMPAQKPGRSKQDYQTPPELLAAVKRRLDIAQFDADLAATAENTVAAVYYTETIDALHPQARWNFFDGWNWLNPPFGDIEPWVEKAFQEAAEHGARTVVLVPASVGANWWRDWVHMKASVLFLNGRIVFKMCDGPYIKDCALLLYSPPEAEQYYDVWNWRNA